MEHLIYSPESLGHALKRERKAKKINQRDMGDMYRLEQSTVSDVEPAVSRNNLPTKKPFM